LSSVPVLDAKPLKYELDIRITEELVRSKLKSIKTDKSPGPDHFHPRVLHELADQPAVPITLLFHKSIDAGEVPLQWRIATVSPIFKKGDRADPANYRPVSLTSVLCKILERIISKAILKHLSSITFCATNNTDSSAESPQSLTYWKRFMSGLRH
jgi:hypothetical protein